MNTEKSKFQPRFLLAVIAMSACAGLSGLLSSCASDEDDDDDYTLEQKLKKRNDWYLDWQHRRQLRQDARQERTDAWFDRVMH